MQKLTIKNFGPITDVSIEVKKINIFIGPQASGKSTISKAIYFFQTIRYDLLELVLSMLEKGDTSKPLSQFNRIIKKKFLDYWGSTFHLKTMFLSYDFNKQMQISLKLEPRNKFIDPQYSKDFQIIFKDIIQDVELFQSQKSNENDFSTSSKLFLIESERRQFLQIVERKLDLIFGSSQELLFLPAGRSLAATISDQLQYLNVKQMDYLMREFIEKINAIKSSFTKDFREIRLEMQFLTSEKPDISRIRVAEKIINSILKGTYKSEKNGEKLFYSKNQYVKINFASSGQQESLWILLLLYLNILYRKKIFVVIEEPEAHLFPEAQQEIINLIALLSNTLEDNITIITTHSPYILSSMNNLLYAHKVGQLNFTKVNEKIDSRLWLPFSELTAYFVDEGEIKSITDEELQMIKVEEIDSASRKINANFDYLLNLEIDELQSI